MDGFGLIATLSGLILLILVGRALYVVRKEKHQGKLRGSEPGTGYHTIHAEYSSGISGHSTTYRIPRDPKEYEKLFVPKSRKD